MENKLCKKCGAHWIAGQLFWSTGKPGREIDLAGLVCNENGDHQCINPCKGQTGGQTWGGRMAEIDRLIEEALDKREE